MKTVVFLFGPMVLAFPMASLALAVSLRPVNIVLPLTVLVGVQLLSVVEAALDARALHDAPRLWYSRWYVFLFPEDRSRVFLKRVIGLPGEKVEIRGETVYIADRPLEERYLSFLHLRGQNPFPNWGPKTVPAGHLFVLGDNLDTSRDSRFWGFLPVDDVLGQAKVVYFSWDETSEHTRWKRIGLTLR